ncbi:MAG TPA: hypothetical protein VGY56_03150 [Verrucomicrobiae bacterium]|nr:hypothetical protein [Verrucomicrobiae bacterium]
MKLRIILAGVVVAGVVAVLIFAYLQMSKERVLDAQEDQPVTAASSVQTDSNGLTTVSLDLKTQQLIGLQIAALTPATAPIEIKAYGRVLDSATLISLRSDVLAADASLQASQQQYLRLKQLASQNNASAQALETAEAQLRHDQSALDTAKAQLVAATSAAILSEPEDFFKGLAEQKSVLIRLDAAAGDWPADSPVAGQLLSPVASRPIDADFIGRAAATDPMVQGAGFIFAVTNAPAVLTPGLAVTGFLQLPGGTASGTIVPDAAVVRFDGGDWIYVQANQTNFERRRIILDRPMNDGWFVTNNIAPNDNIIVTGAQDLLSEEHKAEIQMGD